MSESKGDGLNGLLGSERRNADSEVDGLITKPCYRLRRLTNSNPSSVDLAEAPLVLEEMYGRQPA